MRERAESESRGATRTVISCSNACWPVSSRAATIFELHEKGVLVSPSRVEKQCRATERVRRALGLEWRRTSQRRTRRVLECREQLECSTVDTSPRSLLSRRRFFLLVGYFSIFVP